jgi:hypothetical protein
VLDEPAVPIRVVVLLFREIIDAVRDRYIFDHYAVVLVCCSCVLLLSSSQAVPVRIPQVHRAVL